MLNSLGACLSLSLKSFFNGKINGLPESNFVGDALQTTILNGISSQHKLPYAPYGISSFLTDMFKFSKFLIT